MTSQSSSKKRDWPEISGYEIEAVIGRGGMGRVFRARDLKLGRTVAVKCLLHSGDEHLLQRFVEEARAVAQLQHPNLAQLYEFEREADPPYFVMEYLAGGTLADLLKGRPVEAHVAARVIATLAHAIHYAHSKGIIHRDLKPGNILIAEMANQKLGGGETPSQAGSPANPSSQSLASNGRPTGLDPNFDSARLRVADFGLARQLSDPQRLTRTGEVLGTPEYMSPEQATGIASRIGPGCDIYSLGAMLYELLTGRPPFVGPDSLQTVMRLLSEEPLPPRSLVPRIALDIQTICLKCLEKKPNRRYVSAGELAADLERFQRGEPILARPVSAATRLVKWAGRRPWQAAALGLLLLSIAGAAVGIVLLQAANRTIYSTNQDLLKVNDALSAANRQAEEAFRISQNGLNGIVTEVRNRLGDIPQAADLALDVVRDTTSVSRQLWKMRPDDATSARQFSQSLEIQRVAEWLAGNDVTYRELLLECRDLLQTLVLKFPDDLDLSTTQVKVWMDLADEPALSDAAQKAALDQQIRERLQQLLEGAPAGKVFKLASEQATRELNQAASQGHLEGVLAAAARHTDRSRQYLQAASEPEQEAARFWLIQSLISRSRYLQIAQEFDAARQALEEGQALLAKTPAELHQARAFREHSASLAERQAEVALANGNSDSARQAFATAADQYQQLANDFPEDLPFQILLAEILIRTAALDFQNQQLESAQRALQRAEQVAEAVLKMDSGNSAAQQILQKIVAMRQATGGDNENKQH